jgi:hypothetical protein
VFPVAGSATSVDQMVPSFSVAMRGDVTAKFYSISKVLTESQDEQDLTELVDPVTPSKNQAAKESDFGQ